MSSDYQEAKLHRDRLDATRHIISYALGDRTPLALDEMRAFIRVQIACDDSGTISQAELNDARGKLARIMVQLVGGTNMGAEAALARVLALMEEWEKFTHSSAPVVYAPQVRAAIQGTDARIEQASRTDEYLKEFERVNRLRAQAEESERLLRAEIEDAFRKHGLAAGPQAVDALVEQRDDAVRRAASERTLVRLAYASRDRSDALVEDLANERNRLKKDLEQVNNHRDDVVRRADAAEEALRFYADPDNYNNSPLNETSTVWEPSPIRKDSGERAKQALVQIGKANRVVRECKSPVCDVCKDTHIMHLSLMCTHCPPPCQKCRKGGNGPYCEKTPCDCECHKTTRI